MRNLYIIGCGGVGSWFSEIATRLVRDMPIIFVDGDLLEAKNLDRQFFPASEVGRNKAEILAGVYGGNSITQWYSAAMTRHEPDDWLIVCVDNHAARNEALKACDMCKCSAIIAGNETHSAEAYVYRPEWKDTNLDPRIYYKEIATDKSNDPRRASIGCTGEAQLANPQLASANFMAAALAVQLFVCWVMELPKMEAEVIPHLPNKLASTLTRLQSTKAQLERTDDKSKA